MNSTKLYNSIDSHMSVDIDIDKDVVSFDKIKYEIEKYDSLEYEDKKYGRSFYFIDHIDKNDKETNYVVILPGCHQKGRYISGISLSCFREREAENWHNSCDKKPIQWCSVVNSRDKLLHFKHIKSLAERHNKKTPDLNLMPNKFIRVEGIFNFYEKIGYDYKKKRYINDVSNVVKIKNKSGKFLSFVVSAGGVESTDL